ncbi:MAG TPA: peptidase U32 family protein, partial [Gemmatales bacterium]|nr:peptidase U32 family protein [Gemmatales bacterium]
MQAAVANGADAVYFGLTEFNARHRAHNFNSAELPKIMQYLHERNVKGYLTFNILIFTQEFPTALKLLEKAKAAMVDAVIVQDLGLAYAIQQLLPGLAVHASTQMTMTEPYAINLVKELGIQRVILARELSVTDIGKIRSATDIPLEVFVHGALCVSYSGQCLTSEALGGRSANRGQCAQACRLPYELIVDGKQKELGDRSYLLSLQDLAAHELVPELMKHGVVSFKIEGRLKKADYVAATVQAYRRA